MNKKPVIIRGGGLWGGLLALRLRQCRPEIPFLLHESQAHLGEGHTLFFHEEDVYPEALEWLKPLLAKIWKSYEVSFPRYIKQFSSGYFAITPESFHQYLTGLLGDSIVLNSTLTQDEAIREGKFVFDATEGPSSLSSFQKFFALHVELVSPHRLQGPVLIDTTVNQKEGFRSFSYYPWDEHCLLIRDTRYSSSPEMNQEDFHDDIFKQLEKKGWEVKRIIGEEKALLPVSAGKSLPASSERVIPFKGLPFPEGIKLLSQIMRVSFFDAPFIRHEMENYFSSRRLVKAILPNKYQRFYRLPHSLISRYRRDELTGMDKFFLFVNEAMGIFSHG